MFSIVVSFINSTVQSCAYKKGKSKRGFTCFSNHVILLIIRIKRRGYTEKELVCGYFVSPLPRLSYYYITTCSAVDPCGTWWLYDELKESYQTQQVIAASCIRICSLRAKWGGGRTVQAHCKCFINRSYLLLKNVGIIIDIAVVCEKDGLKSPLNEEWKYRTELMLKRCQNTSY